MEVKESDFIGSKDLCVKILKDKGFKEIGMLATLVGVPVIMILLWYEDEFGKSEKVTNKMNKIIKFYEYTKIERC